MDNTFDALRGFFDVDACEFAFHFNMLNKPAVRTKLMGESAVAMLD